MSVSVTVNVSSLSGGLTPGAYILVTLLNCGSSPTVVNTSTIVPITQKFYPLNGVVTCTLYDNITQIACEGNMLSYYSFALVSSGVTTFIKNVELPPGIFNLANLANVTTPPWQAGVIQGPPGSAGPAGVGGGTPFTVQFQQVPDGVNRIFSLPFSNTPTLMVVVNNTAVQNPFLAAPYGYTTLNNTVTFNSAPQIGDELFAFGTISSGTPSGTTLFSGGLLGTKDGVNKVFQLTNAGTPIGVTPLQAIVWQNVPLIPGDANGYDLGPSAGEVTFKNAPQTTDSLFGSGAFTS